MASLLSRSSLQQYSITHSILLLTALMFTTSLIISSTHGQQLTSDYYDSSCRNVQIIVRSSMITAFQKEARMAASILRLFFHDCFVQGCDGSVLLDDTSTLQGEKNAFPNANSLRGFDVIDTIKTNVESACPGVVSCADILALAARDGVWLSGGPSWSVLLGRRDSTTASYSQANQNLPGPTEDLSSLTRKFQNQGLSVQDLVTLSGAHTIGQARCVNFRQRLYYQNGNDSTLDTAYLSYLQGVCPSNGSGDNLSPLDLRSPTRFDNCYYNNLLKNRGLLKSDQELLKSDQELYSTSGSSTISIVQSYGQSPRAFFTNFPTSMIALGNLNPLTGTIGQIRKNCRVVN